MVLDIRSDPTDEEGGAKVVEVGSSGVMTMLLVSSGEVEFRWIAADPSNWMRDTSVTGIGSDSAVSLPTELTLATTTSSVTLTASGNLFRIKRMLEASLFNPLGAGLVLGLAAADGVNDSMGDDSDSDVDDPCLRWMADNLLPNPAAQSSNMETSSSTPRRSHGLAVVSSGFKEAPAVEN